MIVATSGGIEQEANPRCGTGLKTNRPGYSGFRITVSGAIGPKWFFHQEKATFHNANKATQIRNPL
jgi:hypothetical protein